MPCYMGAQDIFHTYTGFIHLATDILTTARVLGAEERKENPQIREEALQMNRLRWFIPVQQETAGLAKNWPCLRNLGQHQTRNCDSDASLESGSDSWV